MRRLKCFGVLQVLFIIFLLSLSVFSNANAITLTTEVEATGGQWTVERVNCTYQGGTVVNSTTAYCVTPQRADTNQNDLTKITPNFTIPAKEGYYYKTYMSIKSDTGEPEVLWRIQTSNDWIIAGFEEIVNDSIKSEILQTRIASGGNYNQYTEYDVSFSKFYEITLKARSTNNLTWSFGDGVNAVVYNNRDMFSTSLPPLVTLYTIEEFKPISQNGANQLNEKDDQDRNDLEQQSGDIDSEAQDTSSDLSNASSNIFTQASNILGAFNTPSTDCIISITTGSQGSLRLNNMNICNMPSEMRSMTQTILTIVVAIAVLFIGWNVVRTTLEVYNEILGG